MKIKNLKWKNLEDKNRSLFSNFSNLSVLYSLNLLVPFIIYPYLIRVLGSETYGLVIYAQAIITYFVILIGFGFNLSGVKLISMNRNNKQELGKIISSILIIKFLLFIFSCIALVVILFFLPAAKEFKVLFIFSMSAVLSELLFPIWYFQGIEEMSYWTKITLVSRFIYLGLIFLLIRSPDDYLYVPLAIGFAHMVAGLIAVYVVFFKHNIKFSLQSYQTLKFYFLDSLPLFLSGLSFNIISANNKFIIGQFLGMGEVAYYDLADKLRTFFKLPQTIINLTIFPKVSREKNIEFVKKMFKIIMLVNLILVCIVVITSPEIIAIFAGEEMLPSVRLVNTLMFSIVLIAMKDVYGVQILIPHGYNKTFTKIILMSLLVYLTQMIIIWMTIGFTSMFLVISTLITELFMVICMFYYCKKFQLWT